MRRPQALAKPPPLTKTMQSVVERMARAQHSPLHTLQPTQARAAYAKGADTLELPIQSLQRVENVSIPTRDGKHIAGRLYAPNAKRLPVLVYFHGGGFTIGSIDTHDRLCRNLSHLTHCAVLSVDYRLAPQYKFPTAANDAWDAVLWLQQAGRALGLDTTRVAVGGDSAGGTLATVCAIEAKNAGLPLALQLLFYPGCGAHQATDSHRMFASGYVLEALQMDYFFGHYVRTPADRCDWRFAPLDGHTEQGQLADLAGVAPVWLGLAECDPLVDECLLYADRLRMAGVAVDLEIYQGVVHEFIKMGRAIPEAKQAQADAARALQKAFEL